MNEYLIANYIEDSELLSDNQSWVDEVFEQARIDYGND